METIREQVQLVYDLFTFNFDLHDRRDLWTTLPAEIFPVILRQILWYDQKAREEQKAMIGLNHWQKPSVGRNDRLTYWENIREFKATSPVSTLRSCSLVSRYWANQCRRFMFQDKSLLLADSDAAKAFRRYALQGSPNLIPVYKLVGDIHVIQRYYRLGKTNATPSDPFEESFLDLVYIPSIASNLFELKIHGPVPTGFPAPKLDTPHWSRPNLACLPSTVTNYKSVGLLDITIPSFAHVIKYLRHFRGIPDIHLSNITWTSNSDAYYETSQLYLPRPLPTMRNRSEIVVQARKCTDNFTIGLYTAAMYSDSPIHILTDQDQQWVLHILHTLRDFHRDVDTLKCIGQDTSQQSGSAHTSLGYDFKSCESCFNFYEKCPPRIVNDQFESSPSHTDNSADTNTSVFRVRPRPSSAYHFPYISVDFYCGARVPSSNSKPTKTDQNTSTTAVTNRSSPKPVRVVSIILTISLQPTNPQPTTTNPPSSSQSTIEFTFPFLPALRNHLEQNCALRSTIIVFDSHATLQLVTERYPSLRDVWPNVGCVYRFLCVNSREVPFPGVERGRMEYWESWCEEVDPGTLGAVGELRFLYVIVDADKEFAAAV